MNTLALLLAVCVGCASTHYELRPSDASGQTTKVVAPNLEVGLAYPSDRDQPVKLVRMIDGRPSDVFVVPRRIAGVPPSITRFDYAIQPIAGPETFALLASGNAGRTVYTVTWLFTWNGQAFTIGEPTVATHDVGRCDGCS